MLASYFGANAAGFFALSKMVLTAPVALIGQSVSTVFYPKFNESNNLGLNKFKLLLKANLTLLAIGFIPIVVFMFIAPWLFAIIFGEEWITSGHLASWLSMWVFISLVAQPSVAAIPVLKIQAHYLFFEIIALIVRFLSLYISHQLKLDIIETIMLFSIANLVLDLFLVFGVLFYAAKAEIK
jgi:O-antigen/teichoic acid export membrane protein